MNTFRSPLHRPIVYFSMPTTLIPIPIHSNDQSSNPSQDVTRSYPSCGGVERGGWKEEGSISFSELSVAGIEISEIVRARHTERRSSTMHAIRSDASHARNTSSVHVCLLEWLTTHSVSVCLFVCVSLNVWFSIPACSPATRACPSKTLTTWIFNCIGGVHPPKTFLTPQHSPPLDVLRVLTHALIGSILFLATAVG